MLLPFVRWLYGTPSPDTPLYCLLPNMSESSGTPGKNSPGFSIYLRGKPPKVDCGSARSSPIANAFLLSGCKCSAGPDGLLPNMSESSGTQARTALGLLSPQCFPSRALPAPHSGDHYHSARGMGVVQQTSF